MTKEILSRDVSGNQYFPSFGSSYSYSQHQNKVLLQKREDLKHELLITQKLWSAFPSADEYISSKRTLEPQIDLERSLEEKSSISCKPPEIRLSTAKVFRYRPFSLILTMSSTWREKKGLSFEQVFQSVTALKCKKEGEEEEFATCSQCGGKNIIEIGSSTGSSYQPTVSDDKTEMYIFDHCKTNCSSSRDHHKKKLQIVITLNDEKVVTVPFSIQAREKKTSKGKIAQALKQEQQQAEQQQNIQPTPPVNVLHTITPTQNFNQFNPIQQPTTSSSERVAVFVFSTCLQQKESVLLIQNYKTYLEKIEGFVNIRVSFLEGLVFVFVYFMDVAHAEECVSMTKMFVNNDARYPNMYKKKLADDNLAILLTTFHNWNDVTQAPPTFFPQAPF
ncbi:hypothetical protein EIN_370350 [Entamoeba invadens IP1]|uniref:Uncharacterized protein n=1 Tax=Entamoeba invadens IP1 TaxID=370355 RepID=A0A0A1UC33_ENTIV|nr:hypothetical protein EIN_370350 [Entamoeba invadens IP1]ELP92683.1 hypothetical protein EIN_370350 [Entamoeba invadens IP1]|eukprot:XP_004259454.1 hypothetical protein EIN_370350 [Entamoeba invadens IP1]